MARTSKYRDQHVDLLKLATELASQLDPRTLASDASAARSCLSKLMGKLILHLASEEKHFYPELESSKSEQLAKLAKSYSSEMKGMAKAIEDYNRKWGTPTKIAADPAAFIADTKSFIATLQNRIRRENSELYAAADRTEGVVFA